MNKFFERLRNVILMHPRFRRSLVSFFYPDEEINVNLMGVNYRVNKRKEDWLIRASKISEYSVLFRHELPQLVSFSLLLGPSDCIVDIGANIGLHCALYAKLLNVFPTLSVYAFEPNPDTFVRLEKTMAMTGYPERIHIFQFALSNFDGQTIFARGAGSSEFGIPSSKGWQIENEKVIVQCKRLDSLIELQGKESLVLKIDVEGHEKEVIEGCQGFFKKNSIAMILVDGYTDRELPHFLIGHNFRLFDAYTLLPYEPSGGNNKSIIGIHLSRLQR